MSAPCLAVPARAWLGRLAPLARARGLYLAGSAALCLHLEHRPVRHLDLMGAAETLVSARRRDLLLVLRELDPGLGVETARDGYLHARAGDGTGLRFFHYPYRQLEPGPEIDGLPVASRLDLAAMKLAAVIARATRRDFVDLYLLSRDLPLPEVLDRAAAKFDHVGDFAVQALKGLADRERALAEPMPELTAALDWDTVAAWADALVVAEGRRRCGLPGELP